MSPRGSSTESSRAGIAGGLALAVLIAAFLVLKLFALRPHLNDDGIYFYSATAVAAGAVPYRDFFHAHPPLHIAPTALLFVLFGYSFTMGKALVFLLASAHGVCAYLVVRRLARDRASLGVIAGWAVSAAALVLFCESFLVSSSDDTGLIQSSALLAFAITSLAFNVPLAAGALAGAAVMTSLQTLPLALALVATAAALGSRRIAIRVAASMGAVLVGVHLLALVIAGRAFVDQVYLFHLAKVRKAGEGTGAVIELVLHNFTLFVLGGTGLAVLWRCGETARRLAFALAGAMAFHVLAMGTRPRVFYWYFVPVLLPMAIAAALGGVALTQALKARLETYCPTSPRARMAVCLGAAGALGLALALVDPAAARGIDSPHIRGGGYSRLLHYQWQDAPGLGPLNGLVRMLFWRSGTRSRPGGRAWSVTEYLWRQSIWFDTFSDVVAAVRRAASTRPGAALHGDYASTPLVALSAGLPVLNHDVDTTQQRLTSGFGTSELMTDDVTNAPPVLVLLRSGGSGLNEDRRLKAHLSELCTLEARFLSQTAVRHNLHVCDQSSSSGRASARKPKADERDSDHGDGA